MRTHLSRMSLIGILAVACLAGCDRTTPQQYLERGQGYLAKGELPSAIIELKNALQKDPKLAEARLALGEADLQLGDYASAQKELERALDLGVDKSRVMPPLLEAKLEFGRYQEVLGALDGLASTPRLDVIRGRALLMSGDANGATTAFRAALAADPKAAMAYVGLAQIALTGGDQKQALDLLGQAVKADPRSRPAWLARGDVLAMQQQYDDALAAFDTAGKLPPHDLLPQLGAARVLILQGKLDEADAAVDKVLARAPNYPMANYFKGLIAFQKKDYDAAEKSLRIVQQQAPDHPPTMLLLGTVKYLQGQPAEAESLVGRYVAHDPTNVSARRLLAAIRLSSGNAQGAIDALEPVAAGLQDPQSLALLGTAYLRAGDKAKATAYLQRAVDKAPDAASLRTQLALSLVAGGDTEDAISQLETAVGLDDKLLQSDVLLILLRLKQGDLKDAETAAVALTQREPKNPVGFNLLGAVQLAKKDEPAAIAAFNQALAVDPKYSPAALNLAKIATAKGDDAGARKPLEALLKQDPGNVAALSALAQLAVKAGDVAAAKQYLQQARAAHADAFAPRIALGRLALVTNDPELAQSVASEALALDGNSADALVLHAQALLALGNAAMAEPDVDKLDTLVANPKANVRSLIAVAVLERQLGKLDRAREKLVRAAAAAPKSTDALIALVQVDTQRGDAKAANADLDRLRKLGADPAAVAMLEGDLAVATGQLDAATKSYAGLAGKGNRDATLKLAHVQSLQGNDDVAKQTLQRWLSAHPNDYGAQLAFAGFVLKSGDVQGAIARYEALNKARADNPLVLNNLAWLYLGQGKASAVDLARRAYALAPRSAEINDTLGWVLLHQDADAGEALRYLQSAATARPKDASIQYHLAVAYNKLNRRTEARQAVDRSLALGDFAERADAAALQAKL